MQAVKEQTRKRLAPEKKKSKGEFKKELKKNTKTWNKPRSHREHKDQQSEGKPQA